MSDAEHAEGTVVVSGLGAITALGEGVERTFEGVLAGRRGMQPIQRFDPTGCRVGIAAEAPDPVVFHPPGRALLLGASRTARLAAHAAREALVSAGYENGAPAATGLVLGSTGAGDRALEDFLERGRSRTARSAFMARYPKRAATDYVAAVLGLDGPRATINSACSSSLVALIHAIEWVRAGLCPVAVAGGADELSRSTLSGFCSLRAVDPEPCRPFDRRRRGMSVGEGAGFVVVESLERARDRGAAIAAVIAGYGHSCDAHHLTAPDPAGAGAARAIRVALASAGIGPGEIGFVNAHGTATPHNDRAELAALSLALGPHLERCPVHSVKACLGHCMGAAGVIETIVAIRSLGAGVVPHTPGLEQPERPGAADFVMGQPRRVETDYALTNSFGFGGNDAVLVLARPEVVT